MFRSILITVVLLVKLMSCTNSASKEDATSKTPTSERSQGNILQTIFRFSKGFVMFFSTNGIPYQYHVPRVELRLEDLNNGRVKIHQKEYRPYKRKRASAPGESEPMTPNDSINRKRMNSSYNSCWRLAVTTRALTDLEQTSAHLWRRDPVPLNRLMFSLESPVFLGHFFYALTSLTEVNGSSILSRFYYAPVLVARYGRKHSGSGDLIVKDVELNVFSICLEPSDAPGDVSIPLMHRPQRIINVGLRNNSHNAAYDVREKLRANSTEKLNEAEKIFANTKWDSLFSDRALMAFRQLPAGNSPYDRIKTLFGDYHKDYLAFSGPMLAVFHGYDFHNDAYVFAHGPGNRFNFSYGTDGIKLLIFLNPSAHFKDENKLWEMCVDLWKQETHARYGTDVNSRLVHPHAYLDESASTAPYYEMLPRYEALGTPQDMGREPQRRVGQPSKFSRLRKLQCTGGSRMPKKRKSEDMRSEEELPSVTSKLETVTGPEETDHPSPPCTRHPPAGTVQRTCGLNSIEKSKNGLPVPVSDLENSGTLLISSPGCSSGPSTSGTSDLPDNRPSAAKCYAAGILRPTSSSSIETHENRLLPMPPAYVNPLAASLPFGSVCDGLVLPLLTDDLLADEMVAAANILLSMQQARLSVSTSTPTFQQQED